MDDYGVKLIAAAIFVLGILLGIGLAAVCGGGAYVILSKWFQ